MRLTQIADPLAQRLLELRKVSAPQWLLRGLGAVATAGALLVAAPGALDASLGSVLASLVVATALVIQVFRPDSDLGVLAPAAVVLLLVGQPDLGVLRAAVIGLALLVAHMAFAIAATIPVHGVQSASGWALIGRGALMVLAGSVVAGLLVVLLLGITPGPWMVVPGIIAVIALFATVLPRAT